MRRSALPIGLLISAYLMASLFYNVTIPPWEAPDEVGHFLYIVHILQTRSLPRMEIGQLGQAHQPPLYYLLAALPVSLADLQDPTGAFRPNPRFIWAGGDQPNVSLHDEVESEWPYRGWALGIRLARLFSALLGACTVFLIYHMARLVFPGSPAIPLLAAGIAAFNPQFLFISSAVNNDNLLILATTGLLWHALLMRRRMLSSPNIPLRWWLGLGGWIGIIGITKLLGGALVAFTGLALVIWGWRARCLLPTLRGLIGALLLAAAMTSWWGIRNQALYGDPLGWQIYRQVFAVNLRTTPFSLEELEPFLRTQFRSFWGVFGWMSIESPAWFYWIPLAGLALAGVGWLIRAVIRRPQPVDAGGALFLMLAVLAHEALMLGIAQQANASIWQGRYLFPVIGPIAILMAGGLLSGVPSRWPRLLPAIALALSAAWLALAVYIAHAVIRNAYPPPLRTPPATIPNPADIQFGDMFRLRGFDIRQRPGSLRVVLYWEALRRPDFDYSVFVHLIGPDGRLIGQRDHAPGADVGRPPTAWSPGEIVVDPHPIPLPAFFSGQGEVRIGVYRWATGERLPALRDGSPAGDSVTLSVVEIHTPWIPVLIGAGILGAIATAGVVKVRRRKR
ncbi:MAG: glycosyltransferase family 39 protein [Thermoflexus sp.]|uniref:glycosyltransferase family 39 protein n=1 Tax=Thermoflexus sp. TaxID=1969742 RepID=UPI0025CF2DE2|nr:glycosyltransferase family 39 protein [Thermoflexus sp.]MCS6963440.1 glycosyltransferase family 39 protein [Thermoflexus sp.]MCS7350382.1 glycosyltransferase family 39 protein [Thermoflexus sp.]MDW8179833.1 glycosyltransferase family 39 protein [Anaerolineae bacterium]MDW8184185.1 glycosyltransferase family 39 protein [Anaerolineae bacterium]